MVSEVAWGDGTGDKIYLTYSASEGSQTVAVSSDANTGAARSKTVTFSASGVSPVTLTVTQAEGRTKKEATISVDVVGYDSVNISYQSIESSNPIANGYGSDSSTTYCRFYLVTGAQAESYIYYKFGDLSAIPVDATIKSVSANVKSSVSSTGNAIAARQVQLATGTTLKGSATTTGTSASTRSVDGGTWTRAELQDARVRYYARRSNSSTTSSYNIRAYGATLTVTYEYYE